jgi:signal transduction histidine kinase/putative methionine-R-sulfoxide reductase with GAF domain
VTIVGRQEDDLSRRVATLEAALAREERIAKALREVGNALGTTLDLDDLLELILGRLTDLLEADRSTLYLLDQAKGELVSRIVIGEQVRSIRIRVGHGIAGTVAKTGKPIRLKDAYQDARFEPEWDLFTGYRTKSMLAFPLKNHMGRTIGVIQVLNKQTSEEFTSEDEAILAALSTQAAVAIDNSRLFLSLIQKNHQLLTTKDQLERRVTDLQLLFELERSMAHAVTLDDLVRAVLPAVARASEAEGASLLLGEEDSGDLQQYVYDGARPESLDRFGIKAGEGLLAHAMLAGEPLELADASGELHFHPRVEGRFPFTVQSCLILPLEGEQRFFGAIGLFSKRGGRQFDQDDKSLLGLVSANVSTAVRLFRASEQRVRSQRLTTIGRLLSQVIHDFKTPMTVISGHVQVMANEDDPKQRAEHRAAVLKQFDVLSSMQREVLEFARGERRIFVRRVYLARFFEDIQKQVEALIESRPIQLEMEIDTKATARFDETKMARAVQNLARNAVEAMAERGGTLTIYSRMEHDNLLISVKDTGPGIPPEIEGRLFQSFVTAGKQEGTGLGLAIVKKIVEEHKGTIRVHSTPAGATFELTLPQRIKLESVLPASGPLLADETAS